MDKIEMEMKELVEKIGMSPDRLIEAFKGAVRASQAKKLRDRIYRARKLERFYKVKALNEELAELYGIKVTCPYCGKGLKKIRFEAHCPIVGEVRLLPEGGVEKIKVDKVEPRMEDIDELVCPGCYSHLSPEEIGISI